MSKESDLEARNIIINMIMNVLIKYTRIDEESCPALWMKVESNLENQLNDLMKQRTIHDYFVMCDDSLNTKGNNKITCTVRAQPSPGEKFQDYTVAVECNRKGKSKYEILE